MKRYYVNGKEISEQKAKEIQDRNKRYMESGDFELMLKCEFITIINKKNLYCKTMNRLNAMEEKLIKDVNHSFA